MIINQLDEFSKLPCCIGFALALLFNVEQVETGCRSQIGSKLWRRFDSRRSFSYCLKAILALGELRC
jgi:hypothetical protein